MPQSSEGRLQAVVAFTVIVGVFPIVAPFLMNSERYRNVIAAGMCAAALAQLLFTLRRMLAGHRSAYPPSWILAHRLLIRAYQVTIALAASIAWGFTLHSMYVAVPLLHHGMIAESLANRLFGALIATMVLLEIIGPRNYENRDLVRIPLWIILFSTIVVLVQYAPVGGY
jgi:hypothetical protein